MSGPITSITVTNPTHAENLNPEVETDIHDFNIRTAGRIFQYHHSEGQDKDEAEKELKDLGIHNGWLNPRSNPNDRYSPENKEKWVIDDLNSFVETRALLNRTGAELKAKAESNNVNLDDTETNDRLKRDPRGKHLTGIYDQINRQKRNEEVYLKMMDFRHPPITSSSSLERKTKYQRGNSVESTGVFNHEAIAELQNTAVLAKQEIEKIADRARTDAMWDTLAGNLIRSIWG